MHIKISETILYIIKVLKHVLFPYMSCINKIGKRTNELSNRFEISLEFIVSRQSYCVYSFAATKDTDAIEVRKRGRVVFARVGVGSRIESAMWVTRKLLVVVVVCWSFRQPSCVLRPAAGRCVGVVIPWRGDSVSGHGKDPILHVLFHTRFSRVVTSSCLSVHNAERKTFLYLVYTYWSDLYLFLNKLK